MSSLLYHRPYFSQCRDPFFFPLKLKTLIPKGFTYVQMKGGLSLGIASKAHHNTVKFPGLNCFLADKGGTWFILLITYFKTPSSLPISRSFVHWRIQLHLVWCGCMNSGYMMSVHLSFKQLCRLHPIVLSAISITPTLFSLWSMVHLRTLHLYFVYFIYISFLGSCQ